MRMGPRVHNNTKNLPAAFRGNNGEIQKKEVDVKIDNLRTLKKRESERKADALHAEIQRKESDNLKKKESERKADSFSIDIQRKESDDLQNLKKKDGERKADSLHADVSKNDTLQNLKNKDGERKIDNCNGEIHKKDGERKADGTNNTKNLPPAFRGTDLDGEKKDIEKKGEEDKGCEVQTFLDDCVPLVLDGRKGSSLFDGRVRSEKIIHLPTMSVFTFHNAHYDITEKERLEKWRDLPNKNRRLEVTHCSAKNPDMISLIMEAPVNTLEDLSTVVGGLPESCLREVAVVVLEGLESLHDVNMAHGRISGKAIAITTDGVVKLDPMVGAMDDTKLRPRGDFFDLGLTIILAALGGDAVFRNRLDTLPKESGSAQWDTLQILRDELKSGPNKMNNQNSTYPSMWTVPWLQLVLFNRQYSMAILDFLQKCFCAENSMELRSHPFLKETIGAWPLMIDMQQVRLKLGEEQHVDTQTAVSTLLKVLNVPKLPESFRTVAPHFSITFRIDQEKLMMAF